MSKILSVADVPALDPLLRQQEDEEIVVVDDAGRPLAVVLPYRGDDKDVDPRALVAAALRLAEPSLARLWDNDEDAVYDRWRELYGVPER